MPTLRDRFNKVMGRTHQTTYRLSKGNVGGHIGKAPILLLTTTGRRSGQPRIPVTARTATPEERTELWPRAVDIYKGYAGYEQKTDRPIAVVILEPR